MLACWFVLSGPHPKWIVAGGGGRPYSVLWRYLNSCRVLVPVNIRP